jgi:hypothetical protein
MKNILILLTAGLASTIIAAPAPGAILEPVVAPASANYGKYGAYGKYGKYASYGS